MSDKKKKEKYGTTQRLPMGCRSFMTFEDESLKEGEVMLQIPTYQSHVTMRGVKAESLGDKPQWNAGRNKESHSGVRITTDRHGT